MADGTHDLFYFSGSVTELDYSSVLRAGGLMLRTYPSSPEVGGSLVAAMKATLGQFGRLVETKVGDTEALITWNDPDASSLRPHRVTWSQNDRDFTLVGDRSPEELLGIAREAACP